MGRSALASNATWHLQPAPQHRPGQCNRDWEARPTQLHIRRRPRTPAPDLSAPESYTSLPPPAVASTRACSAFFLFRVPTLFLAGRFRARLFRACTRTHAPAHTHAQERPTTNDATCGPPAWLTGSLYGGGVRSVRSLPRRAPLLATPIATPLQGGRPERPGLLFLKLPRRGATSVTTRACRRQPQGSPTRQRSTTTMSPTMARLRDFATV